MFIKELGRACGLVGPQVALANQAGWAGMVAGGMGLGRSSAIPHQTAAAE